MTDGSLTFLRGDTRIGGLRLMTPPSASAFDPTLVGWDHLWWADSLDLANEDPVPVWAADVGGASLTALGTGTYSSAGGPNATPCVSWSPAAVSGTGEVTLATPFSIVIVTNSRDLLLKDGHALVMEPGFTTLTDGETSPIEGVEVTCDGDTSVVDNIAPAVTSVMYAAYVNGASSKLTVNGTVTTGTLTALSYTDPIVPITGRYSLLGICDGDVTTDPAWATFAVDAATYYDLTIA